MTHLLEPANLRRIALLLVLSIAAGAAAAEAGVPLAWMIGPMLVATLLAATGWTVAIPRYTRGSGQIVVACAVGLHMTSVALGQVIALFPEMLVIAVGSGLLACAMAPILTRVARADRVTSFFACVPCGPSEMAQLAEQGGGNGPLVGLSQSLRIALVVLIVPNVLMAGADPTALPPASDDLFAFEPLVGVTLVLAVGVAFLCQRIGVVSPFFLGPLALASVIAATGSVELPFPRALIYVGQLLVGLSLGLSFTRELLRLAPRFILCSVAITLTMIVLCSLLAWAIAAIDGFPLSTMILAAAPGSVTEMSLTAEALGLGVAMVTAFHVVRLFIILPLSPLALRLIPQDRTG